MAQYCDNFDLIQEEFDRFGINDNSDSFQSWLGLRGPAGPQGPQGEGMEIKGIVATVADLPTGAEQSDVYLVGTTSPYVAYIWLNGAWNSLGEVAVGPAGPPGPQGEQGEDGTTFTPSVSAEGVISWTNDGGKQNPNPVNIKGPAGERGATGEQGPAGNDGVAATIAVGTVSGLPSGSTPTIVNRGTSSAAVFDFGIPAGATGPQGVQGERGPAGEQGPAGATGPAGPQGPRGDAAILVSTITLASANWTSSDPYTQTVTLSSGATITSNTKVDLQPAASAIAQLVSDGVSAVYIDNTNGVLTAYALGAAPTANLTLQVTYYETGGST